MIPGVGWRALAAEPAPKPTASPDATIMSGMRAVPPMATDHDGFPWHKCRVLITGTPGFVGSHVAPRILDHGPQGVVLRRRPGRESVASCTPA